jgi:hypothetical protein
MLPKKTLIEHSVKLIYGLFILWLGVLAPLVYFDRFAANHHIQPYRFSLFAGSGRSQTPLSGSTPARLISQLRQKMTGQQEYISPGRPVAGMAHALQWSLGQIYLTAGLAGLMYLLFRRFTLASQWTAASADLPAPKKPPRFPRPDQQFS